MKKYEINKTVLDQFYCGCQESMQEVFTEFLNRYTQMKSAIASSYHSNSITELKRCLHSNGPSFMYLGLPEISLFFKKLEVQCTGETTEPVSETDYSTLMQMTDAAYLCVSNEAKLFPKNISSAA